MIEFIKTDKFLLLIVVLAFTLMFTFRPAQDTKELLQMVLSGYLGILTAGAKQNVLVSSSNEINNKLISDLINKE